MTRAGISALALGLALALALASCGGGSDAKLLPGTTAQEITENLESVRELAAERECIDAQDAALEVKAQVDELEGIDPKLKQTLQRASARLNEVVLDCTEETTEEDTEETVPTTTETTKPEKEKPEKEKHEKPEPPETEPEEEEEPPKQEQEPPKGEAKGQEEEPATGPPSGGIGPGGEAPE